MLLILLCIHRDWRLNFTKKSLFHSFAEYQQFTINEGRHVIIKKCIPNNKKTEILGFHLVIVEEAGRLGCCAEGWVIYPRRFVRTYRLYPQSYKSIHGFMALQMTTVLYFETSGRNYPTTWRNNPGHLLP